MTKCNQVEAAKAEYRRVFVWFHALPIETRWMHAATLKAAKAAALLAVETHRLGV